MRAGSRQAAAALASSGPSADEEACDEIALKPLPCPYCGAEIRIYATSSRYRAEHHGPCERFQGKKLLEVLEDAKLARKLQAMFTPGRTSSAGS